MSTHTFGLVNVKMGPVAVDGGMGATLAPVGETVSGTMDMTTTDPTITDFNIEESDSPVESIVSTPGKISLAWSTYDVSGGNLVKFFGGAYTAQAGSVPAFWEAPDSMIDQEVSLEITDRKGNVVTIPRAKISAKMGISFKRGKLGQVDITATVLQPTKVATPRLTITNPLTA